MATWASAEQRTRYKVLGLAYNGHEIWDKWQLGTVPDRSWFHCHPGVIGPRDVCKVKISQPSLRETKDKWLLFMLVMFFFRQDLESPPHEYDKAFLVTAHG